MFLDTNFLLRLIENEDKTKRIFNDEIRGRKMKISILTVIELLKVHKTPPLQTSEEILKMALDNYKINILNIDEDMAYHCGKFCKLMKTKYDIHFSDAVIFFTALWNKCDTFFTYDSGLKKCGKRELFKGKRKYYDSMTAHKINIRYVS